MQKDYKALAGLDFDGTLYSHKIGFPDENREILNTLGDMGICRAIVTGRNLASFMKVSSSLNLPIDYLIFSTGAGTLNWRNQELLRKESLPGSDVKKIAEILIEEKTDFMIQREIPDNHEFYYYRSRNTNRDFEGRIALYEKGARPLSDRTGNEAASQFVVIFPPDHPIPAALKEKLKEFSLIRATSPMDHRSSWLEIFPPTVHKGSGLTWLRHHLNLLGTPLMAVGNDYNDLEMLKTAESAWVVANAPDELKAEFRVTAACEEAGVKQAVESWLKDFPAIG